MVLGSFWMLGAGLSFALMGVFVKLASADFSSPELVFWRSFLALLFISMFLYRPGAAASQRTLAGPHLAMHLRRGLVGFVALVAFFYAIGHLPMSMAVTLNYTSPLFLVVLMPLSLGEHPRPLQYVAVALGFLGVAMLLRPWEAHGDLMPGLIGLFSGFMAAVAYVHVRQLGKLHEPEWRTVFWFAAVGLVGAGALALILGWHVPALRHLGVLLGLGVFATFGQLSMTRAYRTGQTVLVSALAYSTVVFSTLLDVIIWNEPLPLVAWAGITLIVTAGVWAATLNLEPK